jgi:hypothetical protein
MNNKSLINYVLALAAQQRGVGTVESYFVADQITRIEQLLKFTCANTADEYFDRVFANEQEMQESAFERGYQEGRQSLLPAYHPHFN